MDDRVEKSKGRDRKKWIPKMIRKYWVQWCLLAFIFYQVVFTWIPVWNDAKKMEGVDVSALEIENEKGQLVRLSEFKGKPLILNFWASWCVPCRMELPLLTQIYPDLVENEKQLIGINMREPWQTIRRFRQKTSIGFPIFRDDGRLAKKLRIQMIPSIVVIDSDGKVESITSGFRPWIQAYLLWWV